MQRSQVDPSPHSSPDAANSLYATVRGRCTPELFIEVLIDLRDHLDSSLRGGQLQVHVMKKIP